MEYTIQRIEPDEAGIEFYLTSYKAFRLTALQTDPSYFGSTYAREVAMSPNDWRQRILNPAAELFVAVSETREILSSLTLYNAVQVPPALKLRLGLDGDSTTSPAFSHWAVNGVYTTQDARRRGIAQKVMAEAVKFAIDAAASQNIGCLMTIMVKPDNAKALGMYEKAGFGLATEASHDGYLQLFRWFPGAL
ncbi:hypothetical protein QQS21_000594 [Conoideocrella luteorostrata]|uniref:N-acetyltransferase domain-containing protein n=1 Tax=Conoideocrella luteorostrata TaxID=1105319 RepID=A0AAJ0G2P7_9HYPO|nr:hypothetical protein QQS21_000594 [Conoideocrella luteorostrata]